MRRQRNAQENINKKAANCSFQGGGGVICALSAITFALSISSARAETVTAEPDAFLDYIETTQDSSDYAKVTQYIDTGVKAATGIKARMDAVILSNTRSDSAILGARKGSDCRFLILHSNNKNAFAAYGKGNDGKWNDTVPHPLGLRFEEVADFSDGKAIQIYINGEPRVSQTQQSTIQSVAEDPATGSISATWMDNLTLYLFAANNGGTAAWPCRIKLYELKIMKKNAETGKFDLLRHYLPCVKGDRAGLYDTVNGTISYSYGSSDFVAGPVLDKPLDFVESVRTVSGDNGQFFDTLVWGKSGLKSEVDVSMRDYEGDHAILASRGNDGTTSNNTRFYMAYHYQKAFRFAHGTLPAKDNINIVTPTNNVLSDVQNDVRYRITTDTTVGAQSCKVSRNGGEPVEILKAGVDYGSAFSTYLATTNTLYLLAIHKDDGYPTCPSSCALYGAKIWDGDELLRDFVPVVATNSEGVAYAGLYDQVAKRVYKPMLANVKSREDNPLDLDTWQVGGVTNSVRNTIKPTTRLEYVESDGDWDYIDLDVSAKSGLEQDVTMEWLALAYERGLVAARRYLDDEKRYNRLFMYSSYSTTQHAFHYSDSRYVAKNGDTVAQIVTNIPYKVSTRLDTNDQYIKVWAKDNGEWVKKGERFTSAATKPDLGNEVDVDASLYLFAGNEANENNIARFPVKTRVYSLKLRQKQQDGTYKPVRDLVPVRDPVTGGAALWDKVSETYFRNSGRYTLAGGGEETPLNPGMLIIVK